jgi:hypothetical protein
LLPNKLFLGASSFSFLLLTKLLKREDPVVFVAGVVDYV